MSQQILCFISVLGIVCLPSLGSVLSLFFFFNDTATTEIYTLSLHDALPIYMEARAHTARLAWYDAAARLVAGQPAKKQASIAKLVASNAAMDNARDATQIFGGYGYMNEYPVARFYRDAKVLEIREGTSEVQPMIIARELGLNTIR